MELDSVLKQMRTEYTPTEEDRKRVENALTATLLVGSVTSAAHLASGGAGLKAAIAKGSFKLLPLWFKGAVGVSAAVAAVGGGVYGVAQYQAHQSATHRAVASNVAPKQSPLLAQPGVSQLVEHRAEPLVEQKIAASPAVAPAITAPVAKSDVATLRTSARHTQSSPDRTQLTSLGELQLIGEASRALSEGRSEDAHKVLQEHERRYTQTALGQERAGLALLARCAKGDKQAKAEATKFLQKEPTSPLVTRIKRECLE